MASILIRPIEPGDRAFVLDSGWRSIREHPSCRGVNPLVFRELLEPCIDRWSTVVAADQDNPRVVHGWLCYLNAGMIAWAYVKPDRRRRGIMSALASHALVGPTFEILFPTMIDFARLRPRWRPYRALEVR